MVTTDIGLLITRSPDIRGNRPRVTGTGVTVQTIVEWYKLGLNPEEIAREVSHLDLAQVYAALAYYHANTAEIEQQLEQDRIEGERAEAQHRNQSSSPARR
jgi:uncharacterized protein (DUF433 family)